MEILRGLRCGWLPRGWLAGSRCRVSQGYRCITRAGEGLGHGHVLEIERNLPAGVSYAGIIAPGATRACTSPAGTHRTRTSRTGRGSLPARRVVFRVIRIGKLFGFGPFIIPDCFTGTVGSFRPRGCSARARGSGSGRRGGGISFWVGTTAIGTAWARLSCRWRLGGFRRGRVARLPRSIGLLCRGSNDPHGDGNRGEMRKMCAQTLHIPRILKGAEDLL